jgi:hypothetical protein
MPAQMLLTALGLTLPIAVLYLFVGRALWRRGGAGAQSWRLFGLFWLGMGTWGAADGLWPVLHEAGLSPFPLSVGLLHLKVLASAIAFYGLVAYLATVYTGHPRAARRLVPVYVGIYLATAGFYLWKHPLSQHAGTWGMRFEYAVQDPGMVWWTVVGLLFLPPIVASLAYAALYRLAADPESRFRVALTSLSFLGLFSPTFVTWGLGGAPWWPLIEKLLGLAVAGCILLALHPPRALRERWARPPAPHRSAAGLQERIHQLV